MKIGIDFLKSYQTADKKIKEVKNITPQEIKANLILKGISQVTIAQKAGVVPSLVSMVIHGTEKNKKVRRIIAKIIQKPIREVWGK